jgi:2,4-dienoyl-CoA reductase-like NADH-dependent reductase (Old Yellow Enzyme family)
MRPRQFEGEGGFDGVEIHSGYGGYLIAQFLSPYAIR